MLRGCIVCCICSIAHVLTELLLQYTWFLESTRNQSTPGHQQQLFAYMQMLLKCADIGHLAADVITHKRWAYQLEEEFFRQVGQHCNNPLEVQKSYAS